MANLFKGFKQVTGDFFNPLLKAAIDPQASSEAKEKVLGYIWFVRTEATNVKLDKTGKFVTTGTDEGLLDDSYDIYFGTKHYGHYMKGEIPALAEAISKLANELGLDENYKLTMQNALVKGKTVSAALDALAGAIDADKQALEDYKTSNDAKVAKHAVDVIYAKKDTPGADGKTYNYPAMYLRLEDNSYTEPVNVDDFIKDGMIDSVTMSGEYPNKKIIITWNTDSGKEQSTTVIPVSDLYKPYKPGFGINITSESDGDKISAKIKKGEEYLTVTAEGIASTKIKEEIKTQKGITPVGVTVGNLKPGQEIPAGTTLEQLLNMMLLKTIGIVEADKPSASIDSTVKSQTVEKGTKLSPVFTVKFNQGSYAGAESGYTYSAKTECTPETPVISGITATAVKGSGNSWTFTPSQLTILNTVAVKASIKYGDDTNSTLVNNRGEKVEPMFKGSTATTGTVTYTPQVKWFIGSTTDLHTPSYWTEKSDVIQKFGFSAFVTTNSKEYTFPQGAKQQVIAVPAGRKFTAFTKIGNNTAAFSIKETIDFTNAQGHTEKYDVYVAPANDGLAAGSWMNIKLI